MRRLGVVLVLGVGCDGGATAPDATEGLFEAVPEHFPYVVDAVTVPLDATQGEALGFDLDGDGAVDNRLGEVLGALVQATLDVQGEVDRAIASGDLLLRADLEAVTLTSSANVAFALHHGDDPIEAIVPGAIIGGEFSGGPGELAVHVDLRLVEAHVRLHGVTAASIPSAELGGAIPQAEVDSEVIPAIHEMIARHIADDCAGSSVDCGCDADSTGLTLLGIFDDNDDCAVPLAELQTSSLVTTLLRPDVDTDGDAVADALSVGVGITAVRN